MQSFWEVLVSIKIFDFLNNSRNISTDGVNPRLFWDDQQKRFVYKFTNTHELLYQQSPTDFLLLLCSWLPPGVMLVGLIQLVTLIEAEWN